MHFVPEHRHIKRNFVTGVIHYKRQELTYPSKYLDCRPYSLNSSPFTLPKNVNARNKLVNTLIFKPDRFMYKHVATLFFFLFNCSIPPSLATMPFNRKILGNSKFRALSTQEITERNTLHKSTGYRNTADVTHAKPLICERFPARI